MSMKTRLTTELKENIAYWIFILMVSFCVLTSCQTKKKTVSVKSNIETTVKTDSLGKSITATETKYYGDTLNGSGFIYYASDSTDIEAESAGVKLQIQFKSKRDQAGNVIGHDIKYKALAKPVKVSSSYQSKQSEVRKTTKTDESTELVATEKKSGKLGWWVIGLLLILALLLFTSIFNPLKLFK